eukprot:m.79798 g.79798  ORF g.79798 m.79798 type:complete len:636 (+) comp14528_c0_seq1:302-2209(+)
MASSYDDGLVSNPHYRRLSLDFIDRAVSPSLEGKSSLLPRRASTISVAEWDEEHCTIPPTTLPKRDEGMGRSIELGQDSRTPLLAVVDAVTQRCEYFQPELSAKEAEACLQHGLVGSFLVHGAEDESVDDDSEQDAIFGLSFKDEDGSIIHKVVRVNPEGTYLHISHLRFDTLSSMVAFFASTNTTAPCALKLTVADGAKLPHVGRGWYTLELSNRQIEAFLSRHSVPSGAFVVRPCARRRQQYCLSVKLSGAMDRPTRGVLHRQATLYQELESYRKADISPLNVVENGAVRHFMIVTTAHGLQLKHSQLVFPNLVDLVDYYEHHLNHDIPCRLTNLTGSGSCQEVDGQQLYVPTLPLPFTLKTAAKRNDGCNDTSHPSHPIDDRVQPPTSSRSLPSAQSSMSGSQHSLTKEAFLTVPDSGGPGRLTPLSIDSTDSLSSRSPSNMAHRPATSRQGSSEAHPPWLTSPSSSASGSFKRSSVRASRTRSGSLSYTPDKAGSTRRTRSTDAAVTGEKPLDYSPHTLGTTISIAPRERRVRKPQTSVHVARWDLRGMSTDKALTLLEPADGSFVVRTSRSAYAYLSVMYHHQLHHYRILQSAHGGLYLSRGNLEFPSLPELVQYHQQHLHAPLSCTLKL